MSPETLTLPVRGGMPLLHSFVAGEWTPGRGERPDLDPAHPERPVAHSSRAPAELADRAIAAAAEAQRGWAALPAGRRGEVLHRAGQLLGERAEAVGRDLTREEGKTLAEGIGETRRAAEILRYFGAQTLEPDGHTYPSASPTTLLYSRRVPIGVVAAITPWNFPIAIPAWKLAPALAYGNAVVWKPAELVPLTAAHLMAALHDAGLPAGVLNLLLGSGAELGDALAGDPRLAGISFTGSNQVGRGIRIAAAEAGTRVQLELGGKNPAVVLADADLEHATEVIARAAFHSAGQKCTATSRVIVERPIAAELTERLAARADATEVGDPLSEGTEVGPLVSEERADSVRAHLERGGGAQATGRAHDAVDGPCFVAPVVVSELGEQSSLAREEVFGPVVAVLVADGYEDAVRLANDTPYGLSASVFTRDLAAALRFAEDSETGVVKVNQESAGVEPQAPFGGWKESGHGTQEQGKAAAEFYTHWKTVYVDRVEP